MLVDLKCVTYTQPISLTLNLPLRLKKFYAVSIGLIHLKFILHREIRPLWVAVAYDTWCHNGIC